MAINVKMGLNDVKASQSWSVDHNEDALLTSTFHRAIAGHDRNNKNKSVASKVV